MSGKLQEQCSICGTKLSEMNGLRISGCSHHPLVNIEPHPERPSSFEELLVEYQLAENPVTKGVYKHIIIKRVVEENFS